MGSKICVAIFLVLIGFSKAVHAQDGLVFSPSVFFFNFDDEENNSSFAKVDGLYYDVRIGVVSNSLYFGGLYSKMTRKDGTTERERTSTGGSVGLLYNQFYLIGHYIFDSTYKTSSNSKLTDGTGMQVNVGYWFNITGSFYAGPEVIHREIKYKKRDGVSAQGAKSTETLPYLSLGFVF